MTNQLLKGVGAGLGFAVMAPLAVAAWPLSLAVVAVMLIGAAAAGYKREPDDKQAQMRENLKKAAAVLECNRMLDGLSNRELAKVEARNRAMTYQQILEELERIYAMGDDHSQAA
ncbi:hypothetical protein [Vulcanococcus sp.]|uniref:hypothetical protein n=1 Tax=Vulcanococcus sp. TaxID=2856995 RepID=UPI003BFEAAED